MNDPGVRARNRGCVAQGMAVITVVMAIGLFFGLLRLGARPTVDPGPTIALLGALVLSLLLLVAMTLVWAVSRTQVLDGGFAALGLEATSVLVNFRAYRGRWRGREVNALFARRGPVLELSVESGATGALRVGPRGYPGFALRDMVSDPLVPLQDPALAGFEIRSPDPRWAAMVLSDPALRDVVLRAMFDPSGRELRDFAIRPGAMRWTRRSFVPDTVAGEIPAMVELLEVASAWFEALPPPAVPVLLGAREHLARTDPAGFSARVALIAVLGTFVLAVVGTAIALALASSGAR